MYYFLQKNSSIKHNGIYLKATKELTFCTFFINLCQTSSRMNIIKIFLQIHPTMSLSKKIKYRASLFWNNITLGSIICMKYLIAWALILFTFWKTSMGFIFVAFFGCPFVFTFDGLNYSIAPRQNDVMLSRRQGNGLCTHFPTFIVDPGHNLLFVFVHLKYFHIYHTSEVSIIHSDPFFVRNVQKKKSHKNNIHIF